MAKSRNSLWRFKLFLMFAVMLLAACGGGGSSETKNNNNGGNSNPAVPAITSFLASPASISAHETTTLGWNATGATSLSIDHGVGDVTGKSSVDVSPATTTTYTLTATNAAGSSTRSAKVIVDGDAGTTLSGFINPNLPSCIAAYATVTDAAKKQWLDEHFIVRTNGHKPVREGVIRLTYFDIWGIGASATAETGRSVLADLRNWTIDKDLDEEEMFMHSKVNFTFNQATDPWDGFSHFGSLEGNTAAPENGIIKYDGSSYTDFSANMYINNQSLSVSSGEIIFLGYLEPYMEMNFQLQTVGSSVSAVFEYFNGTGWSTLNLQSNTTNNFTADGKVVFVPPADWNRTSINGSVEK